MSSDPAADPTARPGQAARIGACRAAVIVAAVIVAPALLGLLPSIPFLVT